MDELMLKIDNVSKQYKLGEIGGTTLRDELQRIRAKRRGEEDPTKRIGAKDYNKGETFLALDGVSFEVKKGERVGIIGHNGAGKSTLLKLISRVTAPSGGTIYLNGRVASMLEVGTGFHGELTGRENIYMNGAILGMTKKEIDAKMEDIIEFSECRQFIDTPVKRYSSGMYVKLAFSVAAHLDSEIMIMDEVLAVGDMAFQKKCLEKMSDVSKTEGRTILYVSHNMNTIRQLCDRVIVLDHGKVVFDGNVETGIHVYIANGGEIAGKWKYAKNDHRLKLFGKAIINEITLDKEETPVYMQQEPVLINVSWTALQAGMRVYCRILPVLADGTVIGISISEKPIITECNKSYSYTIRCQFDGLMPGNYFLNITFFEINEYGTSDYVALIKNCVSFEILQDSSLDLNIRYDSKQYDFGKIRFPNSVILGNSME